MSTLSTARVTGRIFAVGALEFEHVSSDLWRNGGFLSTAMEEDEPDDDVTR